MSRALWLAVGWSSQLAFALLCLSLMWFLQLDTLLGHAVGGGSSAVAADLLLVILFAVPHSVLLAPPVRRQLGRIMPAQLSGALFCWVSCLSLWLLMLFWQPIGHELWHADGVALAMVLGAAALGWLLLGYSMLLSGFGWQTGLTSFLAWRRGMADPPRRFERRSLYRHIRHPIYVSFLLVSWLVPVMTVDRLVLAIGFTLYIYAGSWAKDRRLLRYVGESYRAYMAEVPGFPLIGIGPLRRVPIQQAGRGGEAA
jgi:methanethiol S-methyltransferase